MIEGNQQKPKVFFWQTMPSHHQAGAIRFLAEHWPGEVHGVYERQMRPERSQLGWQIPDMGKTVLHFLEQHDNPDEFIKKMIKENAEAIHMFGGFRGTPAVETAFALASKLRLLRLGVIAECVNLRGWKGLIRQVGYRLLSRKQRRVIKAALVMGQIGVECYQRLGYLPESLFPYMYQCNDILVDESRPVTSAPELIYVGKMIPRKGVDLMLKALGMMKKFRWRLKILGPTDQDLMSMAQSLGITDRVEWAGPCASDEVSSHLSQTDLCLVPSRYDGWGVVTNEALMSGIGVIASDGAGSSELVRASGAGQVVAADDINALCNALETALSTPELLQQWKQRAVGYAPRITSQIVGEYLADVLRYVFIDHYQGKRPEPSWLKVMNLCE